jgi:hypothetical protein
MRTLVYLRNHSGDPDEEGVFGVNDCMGQVRFWGFEAVIGVGGMGAEAQSWGISGKVTWIGIGPQKHDGPHAAGRPHWRSPSKYSTMPSASFTEMTPATLARKTSKSVSALRK